MFVSFLNKKFFYEKLHLTGTDRKIDSEYLTQTLKIALIFILQTVALERLG